MTIRFKCGCEFQEDANGKIIFNPEITSMPTDCSLTWDLICSGDVKGVFQLESHLGKSMAKRLAPRSIEELSALGALMRPGCLESMMEDGKSLTHHFIERKHGREPTSYYHPALESILSTTYGILTYQEQAMQIAQKIAGFNLQEADMLRKAIGKKKPEEMAKLKTLFTEKAIALGVVNAEEATEIFSWIEKSQRYSFNKSHSVAYAVDGYISAYAKAHFPIEFFTAYLVHSIEESDFATEVRELISNAKNYNIEVLPPDINKGNKNFKIYGNDIVCGMLNVKGVGPTELDKALAKCHAASSELHKPLANFTWTEFLLHCAFDIKNDVINALVSVGALSYLKISRKKMLYEVEQIKELTDRDVRFLKSVSGNTLLDKLKAISILDVKRDGPICSKKKKAAILESIKLLENPPYSLDDNALWMSEMEQSLLGIALTCSKVDDCNTSSANCTCREFHDGKSGPIIIACQLDEVREHTIKNGVRKGDKMAFLKISDSYGSLDSVTAFCEAWQEYKGVLIEENTVLLFGYRDKKNKDTFIVKKAYQI